MTDQEFPIEALRQAVRLAPDNVDLIDHLCHTLLQLGKYLDAETEYRHALQNLPHSEKLQLGLATCYYRSGKDSHALAIIETLEAQQKMFPEAMVLHARLLFRAGDVAAAVNRYQSALEDDPDCGDEEFSNLIGLGASWEDESEVVDGKLRAAHMEHPEESVDVDVERPDIDFNSVGGMESVKEEIRIKIISPLEHADLFAAYGKTIGGGILLYGPPGCGKTHLARATAGEVKATFLTVGINDVLDMWIGSSERNLHEIFEQARRNQPCVLFFDEVDALGARRSDMQQSASRHMINQFLSEMDGLSSNNEGLLILGATNAPWSLDSAFRRPGRFDQIIFVPPPDAAARAEILKIHLQGKPQQEINFDKVAAKCDSFSGADLTGLVNLAVEEKLRAAIRSGTPTPLTTSDLLTAAKKTRPSCREWFSTARNHALYSNEGGLYDDILDYLKIKR